MSKSIDDAISCELIVNNHFFRVSSRTLVTQDDPLGALNEDEQVAANEGKAENSATGDVLSGSAKKHIYTDQPILFRGHRSQTFDESMTNVNKSMHRSETMPGNSVTSSLASSIKFFG